MGKILRLNPKKPENDSIKEAVEIIINGGIIVYPTDTVYGLGGDALNPDAVRKIFKLKVRPLSLPLPVAVSDLKMAEELAFVNNMARKLIGAFWPGALTIVMESKSIIPSVVVSGGTNVGLRMPNHIVPISIIRMSRIPLITTSANKHGKSNTLEVEEAIKQLGNNIDLVIDWGRINGQPSTIIDTTKMPPIILRIGSVTRKMIEAIVGEVRY